MADEKGKIRVHGKAQNRTVLGIVNAYLTMHPQTTADELRKAFPCTVAKKYEKNDNDSYGLFREIVTVDGKRLWKDTEKEAVSDLNHFEQADETIHTADGKELAMVSTWVESDYKAMIEWAKQYGIEVASFEKAEALKKGSYRFEYLDGYVAPLMAAAAGVMAEAEAQADDGEEKKKECKCKCKKWWIILLIILLILLLLLLWWLFCGRKCCCKCGCNKDAVAVVDSASLVEQAKAVQDSLVVEAVKNIEKIEKKFNTAKFFKGKADLSDDTKAVLQDLESLLKENSNLKLKLIGHTSSEGNETYNQKLSEDRAKAAVDFLVSRGIDASRLMFEGKGSSEPVSDNPEENRRTEFVVIEE